jgi:hypothetical protein
MLRSRRLRSGTGNEIAVEHHQIGEHPGASIPAMLLALEPARNDARGLQRLSDLECLLRREHARR